MLNFQEMIAALTQFWAKQGCVVHQGYDLEVGAGTFNPATFLRALGPEPYSAVYVEPSRRPQDGRFGENPNRVQFYHQMQVILKPSPADIQELYLSSLRTIGLPLEEHDVRFVHDDWENPTIGAAGLGWEIWIDGMEVTQFTYFQTVGGQSVKPVSGEITYGLERLAMYLQGVESLFDIRWNDTLTYGDIFKRSEWEWSHYNFHEASTAMWLSHFDAYEAEAQRLIAKDLPLPAYDFVMKASHAFNILEARGVISVTERTRYITRIRSLASAIASCFLKSRHTLGFPLLRKTPSALPTTPAPLTDVPRPTDRHDFLLEIGSEELPAGYVPIGQASLEEKIRTLLQEHALPFDEILSFATPRRLAVLVKGLAGGTVAQKKERKGPSLSAAFDAGATLTKTGEGFFRSLDMSQVTLAEIKAGKHPQLVIRGDYLFAIVEKGAVATRALLQSTLPHLLASIDFPKKMHWGSLDVEYARPIRWIVALYGKEEIPFLFGDVLAGRHSFGHRQLAPQTFAIPHPQDYRDLLMRHFVMGSVQERREKIEEELARLEKKVGGQVLFKERVLHEVLHLVEYPFLLVGDFEKSYLKAPREVLCCEMIEHQRYFPLAQTQGELLPHFVVVSNNKPTVKIQKGHERALAPRLADGLYHFEEDLKTPLDAFAAKLASVTFHKEIGSLAEKTRRLIRGSALLHGFLPLAPLQHVERAAALSKADLVTALVGEFPELQGTAGRLYALKGGELPAVADALEEQWMPRSEKAPLPQTGCGTLLSLAEKLDNLTACFALGLVPTSSSDPYALRRQALGILKIVLQQKLFLPLPEVLEGFLSILLDNPALTTEKKQEIVQRKKEILSSLLDFLTHRLRTLLQEHFPKDEIEAVLSTKLQDAYDRFSLLTTLHSFREQHHDQFLSLLTVFTRTKKILSQEKSPPALLNPTLLTHPSEHTLHTLLTASPPLSPTLTNRDYATTLASLASLATPLHTLFENVKILDDDITTRMSRLSLLSAILHRCDTVADFSKIQEG